MASSDEENPGDTFRGPFTRFKSKLKVSSEKCKDNEEQLDTSPQNIQDSAKDPKKLHVKPEIDVYAVTNEIENIIGNSRSSLPEKDREKLRNKVTILAKMIQDLRAENATLKAATRWLQQDVPNIIKLTAKEVAPTVVPSYSDIAKSHPHPAVARPSQTPNKQLFLKPKSQLTAEKAKETLKQNLKPRENKIKIKSIRSTKTNVLIVDLEGPSDEAKILNDKKITEHFSVEKPRKRNPLMIIYDVDAKIKQEELPAIITSQNFEDGEGNKEDIKPRFRTGPRNKAVVHWVIEVSPQIRKTLLNCGRCYIEYTSCKIKDFLQVAKCSKCKDLGHVQKYCTSETTACNKCGENHEQKDCKSETTKCIPCSKRNKKCNAPGGKECPTYKVLLQRLIDKTNYGE